MHHLQKTSVILGMAICFAGTSCAIRAAQPKKETLAVKEAKAAAAEEAAELKLGEGDEAKLHNLLAGKLLITDKDDENPEVIGTITTAQGRTHMLKIKNNDAKLIQHLVTYNHKPVTVSGRWRNEGKYFLVESVGLPALAPPLQHSYRGEI